MKKEDLEILYRGWDNEKLIQALKKHDEYTEEALAAMLTVMKERNMLDVAEQEVNNRQNEIKVSFLQEQKEYETKMLKDSADAKEYAKKSLVNGEYVSGKIAYSKFRWLRMFLFSLSVASLILVYCSCIKGGAPFNHSLEVSIGISIILIAATILLFRNSKAHYRFSRQGNRDVFELEHSTYSFTATVPLYYFSYWDMDVYQRGLKKISIPRLFLCITNKENETIVLQGYLTTLQTPPPAWPNVSDVQIPKGAKFFNEIVGHRINVIKFKKILDGLHIKE